ncbi:MAG: hypothetical protein GXY48_08760 [Methanomicrobiales archaeon]|nr:hypothetical protein [Methanomicrobiales archaeon]
MTNSDFNEYIKAIRDGSYNVTLHPDENLDLDKNQSQMAIETISELLSKIEWYESVLDAIPFPMSVTDMEMNWTFINRSTEKMLNVNRKDVQGKHCSNWGANICNTSQCGIELLRKGKTFGEFEQAGGHFRTNVAYIEGKNGAKVGHIEIVTDVTDITSVNNYLRDAINHTIQNLSRIAGGNFDLDYSLTTADEHTREVSLLFLNINENLKKVAGALSLMSSDVLMLVKAAVDGDMKTRADASKHEGDFAKIVGGVNDTLDSVTLPVQEALRISKEYANYNFNARVDQSIRFAGDWTEFKETLNNIGVQISMAVSNVLVEVEKLSTNVEEALASITEVTEGAQQIAQNTGEVSNNSLKGEDGIIQVLKAMEDLNITVAEVSRRAEQVSGAATQANEFAKSGVELAKRSESAMNDIQQSTTDVDTIVKDINQQMDEIGKIVRLISDIANQTNLLALNAAIEAARAGEAGRGFAVVASEVKSLAQDSRQSAENITDMITNLQDKARKANDAMKHAGEAVDTGNSALAETLGSFNQIAIAIEEITRNATDVASSSEEQAASVEEVTASINEVSSLVQNTSKEAGDAAAATEEASASIDEISKIIANVNDIVEVVAEEMKKFNV